MLIRWLATPVRLSTGGARGGKQMNPFTVFALVIAWSTAVVGSQQPLPAAAPEKVGMSAERLARIATALNEEIKKQSFPGAVAAIARRGQLVYFESFGFQDQRAGKRMPKDAIFRIYSMTKPWTSVATMMLVEEGRIRLTDPISKFLPQLKSMQVSTMKSDPTSAKGAHAIVPTEREITIHDLLRHTSGFIYPEPEQPTELIESYVKAGLGPDVEDEKFTATEWTEKASKVLLADQPGTAFHYGISTDVLGRVLESATGKRLATVLDERIFRPLQMVDSGFSVPGEKQRRLAQAFDVDPDSGKKVELMDVSQVPGNDLGGVGGVSTVSDYLRFCQMLLAGGRLGGNRILSRTSVTYMASDHLGAISWAKGPPGYTFGLGFAVRTAAGLSVVPGSVGDFTWSGWAGTHFWVDPKEDLTAVLMIQTAAARSKYGRLFRQLVYQAIAD